MQRPATFLVVCYQFLDILVFYNTVYRRWNKSIQLVTISSGKRQEFLKHHVIIAIKQLNDWQAET